MSQTKVVRFIKPYSVYAEGDIAGLTEDEAKAAFAAEAAVLYKPDKQTKVTDQTEDEEKSLDDTEEKSPDKPTEDKMLKNAPMKK